VIIEATDNQSLEPILDLVHDRWVDLDEMTCDFFGRRLAFQVFEEEGTGWLRLMKRESPRLAGTLTVVAVRTMHIKDRAGIGWVSLNRIDCDRARQEVRIDFAFPVEILLSVDEPRVQFAPVGEAPSG
jgi:hypothetical protein